MLLSLFCGAGGLDLGFAKAGFDIGLAFDIREDSVKSYQHNLCPRKRSHAHCLDIRQLTLPRLDELWGREFRPKGIIGGPPCQSFSRANKSLNPSDPRGELPRIYANLVRELELRSPLDFFVFENVVGLSEKPHKQVLERFSAEMDEIGFSITTAVLNAADYGVPQTRMRLIIVGYSKRIHKEKSWLVPEPKYVPAAKLNVRFHLENLPEPTYYIRGLKADSIPFHRNHWCMSPKSPKFSNGLLTPGYSSKRSFKTLAWDKPSITVAYGHREVHVHPKCHRRLSVFEALILQGFPRTYELIGSLSSQITQVSEAVPPPLAQAIAKSIRSQLSLG